MYHILNSVAETPPSIKLKATKVDCTSSSSMSWTLSASNVVRRIAVPVWATVLSTSFCLRFVDHYYTYILWVLIAV